MLAAMGCCRGAPADGAARTAYLESKVCIDAAALSKSVDALQADVARMPMHGRGASARFVKEAMLWTAAPGRILAGKG